MAPGAWRLRKAKSVIKLLALEPTHSMHRDRVTDALWPRLDADAGRNNLHQVVHAARRALSTLGIDGAAALGLHDDLLVLGGDVGLVTDVEELHADVERALSEGRLGDAARALREGAGELLPEDAYEPWVQQHAARFREWRTQQVMRVAEEHLTAGEAAEAVVLLAPVVAADAFHEPASRAMMRALAASGRRSEALLVYERLRARLHDELAADPEPETRQVFRELLTAGSEPAGSAVVPLPRSAGNLPAPVTSFVGRARELTETKAILARTRLLTLTGMGGSGKTTLAVELARRCVPEHPGGVHLVELGALTDGDQVVPQVARAMQLELPSDASPIESVVAQLGRRKILVVLDNCEHLLDACARVVRELLRGCPELSVLATSREALRIEGEVSWRTPSLQLPDLDVGAAVQDLAHVASVELFVQRAAAAFPAFALTEDNAAAVAEICYRLDGIPLALELAAACIPTLSPQQIADRLGDALNLLSRGDRATITRQQTLATTLSWSHDLLDGDERTVFRRMAVFAGSFTLDAVDSVCGATLDQARVLAAVARLVDTSLVVAEPRGDVVRYRLLETVRQYAAEQLKAAGERDEVQQRHLDHYLLVAQSRDPEVAPRATVMMPSSLDVEHDNLRVALGWALQHRPPVALELVVSLWRYWLARGFFAEGRRWLESALAVAPQPTALRARATIALAAFDVRRGSDQRLADLGAEAVDIHRSLGGAEGLARALHADGMLAFMRGSWGECWRRSVEAHEVATENGLPQPAVAATHLQAVVLMARGRLAEARAALDEVRSLLLAIPGDAPAFLPPLLLGFAVDGAAAGSPRVYFEETVLLGRLVGARQAEAYALCNLADVARLDGDPHEALLLARDALARFVELGDRDGEALASSRLGCLHRVRGEFAEGRDALTHSLRVRRVIGDRRAIGLSMSNLGVLTAAEGDVGTGRDLIEEALDGVREIQDTAGQFGLTLTLASLHAEADDLPAAERLLAAALRDSARMPGNHRATAWGHAMLGDVLDRLGRPSDADAARDEARSLFAALGSVDGVVALRAAASAPVQRRQSRR